MLVSLKETEEGKTQTNRAGGHVKMEAESPKPRAY